MIFRCMLLLCFSLFITYLPTTTAQNVAPSNDTSTLSVDRQFVLSMIHTGMTTRVFIEPLTGGAGLTGNSDRLNAISFQGRLLLAKSPQDTQDLAPGFISFISCDPSFYPGPITAAGTIKATVQQGPNAIVLFSTTSARCSFTPSEGFDYDTLYTTTDAGASSTVEHALQMSASGSTSNIMLAARTTSTPSDDSNSFSKSPTTAVAMIILYSITGVITALFLLIIVVGAIRAHRHPERYGPRHVIGRPRQSRAKGIARAMLETLPIVKFGDKDDKPGDFELGHGGGPNQNASPSAQDPEIRAADRPVSKDLADQKPDLIKTETANGKTKPEDETADGSHAENGLACSVCTDDFIKGQDIRVLPCSHKYHPECIDPWLLNVSGTCPLCRVDLRPITTQTSEPVSPISPINSPTDAHANVHSFAPVSSSTNAAGGSPPSSTSVSETNPSTHRRSRTRLSLYIQNTLNRRRMHDATPEERIEALRILRTAQHVQEPEPAAVTERPRNRLSTRLSRAFNPVTSPSPTPDAVAMPERMP